MVNVSRTKTPDKELRCSRRTRPSVRAGTGQLSGVRPTPVCLNRRRKKMEAFSLGLISDRKCMRKNINVSILSLVSSSDSGTNGSALHCTHNNLQLWLSTPGRTGDVWGRDEREALMNCWLHTRSTSDDFCHSRTETFQRFSFRILSLSGFTYLHDEIHGSLGQLMHRSHRQGPALSPMINGQK